MRQSLDARRAQSQYGKVGKIRKSIATLFSNVCYHCSGINFQINHGIFMTKTQRILRTIPKIGSKLSVSTTTTYQPIHQTYLLLNSFGGSWIPESADTILKHLKIIRSGSRPNGKAFLWKKSIMHLTLLKNYLLQYWRQVVLK